MKTYLFAAALLLGAAMAGSLSAAPRTVVDPEAPRALEVTQPVQVGWSDPAQFTELRHSRNRWEAERGDWVRQLAEHLQQSAARSLPPGQRLEVLITDIKRAGDFEPWGGISLRDVRIMRDVYPPRMSLQFTRFDAAGAVLEQGERKLVDMGYLTQSSFGNDALRYEKRLIDDWVRRDLGNAHAGAGQD